MSIATEITRINNAKANIKAAIENKGITVPSTDKIDTYAGYINNIQGLPSPRFEEIVGSAGTTLVDNSTNHFWTDGIDIYYSNNALHKKLNKSTNKWENMTWVGLTNFNGYNVWTDGTDIYHDVASSHYVLDKSTHTWSTMTWNGLTLLYGENIWTDGTNIYYDYGTNHYILDKANHSWSTMTWTGNINFYGRDVWTDGTNIYTQYNGFIYLIDINSYTLTRISFSMDRDRNLYPSEDTIWTDGTDIYYSYNNLHYKLNKDNRQWLYQYNPEEFNYTCYNLFSINPLKNCQCSCHCSTFGQDRNISKTDIYANISGITMYRLTN